MRLFLFIFCLFLYISSEQAKAIDYNDPALHKKRFAPAKQYELQTGNSYKPTQQEYFKERVPYNSFIESKDSNYELKAGLATGYRTSQLKFNIAGDSSGEGISAPNILSELTWKDVNGYEVKPNVEYVKKTGVLKGLYLSASANKSITVSGKNQDSDYIGNDRTGEFSRSVNGSDSGHAEGFSAAIGYAMDFNNVYGVSSVRTTALIGYEFQRQKFATQDGVQVIPSLGAFDGLKSSYTTEWNMPFVGAEITGYFSNNQQLKLNARYYRGKYEATGNWNLRSDLAHPNSFTDEADGNGFRAGLEYGWEFSPHWQLTLSSDFYHLKTYGGTAIANAANGASFSSRFNEAVWKSSNYMIGITYNF